MIHPGAVRRYCLINIEAKKEKIMRADGKSLFESIFMARFATHCLTEHLLPGCIIQRSAVSGQRSAVSGQRSAVSGQRSAVSGQRSAVSGQRSAVSGQRSAVSGQRSAVSGQRSAVMNCVRRLTSAVRSAFSGPARSPSRPEPRPVFGRLLGLALLVGPLAAPATADVLVSNIGQSVSSTNFNVDHSSTAQGFTTGSFAAGYILDSIEVRLLVAGRLSAGDFSEYRAELWSSAGNGAPSLKIASLRPPATASVGNNVVVAFTSPTNTRLAPDTKYHFVLYRPGAQLGDKIRLSASTALDAGGEAGWSLATPWQIESRTPSGTWQEQSTSPIMIRVNGSRVGAVTPPAAPSALSVTAPAIGSLNLSWTAPSGDVTGYDVHYTSAAAGTVADDAVIGSNAATGWVAVSRTGTTASQTISNLTGGTLYRVRVRAVNGGVAGPWLFGAGVTTVCQARRHRLECDVDRERYHQLQRQRLQYHHHGCILGEVFDVCDADGRRVYRQRPELPDHLSGRVVVGVFPDGT